MTGMIEQEDGGGDGEEDGGKGWSRMMDGRWREESVEGQVEGREEKMNEWG